MFQGENFNHPAKGDMIRVEPIRDSKSIKTIVSGNAIGTH